MIQTHASNPLPVTKRNPKEFLYLKGDETTNGSLRFSVDAMTGLSEIQQRILGIWVLSTLETSAQPFATASASLLVDNTAHIIADNAGELVAQGGC